MSEPQQGFLYTLVAALVGGLTILAVRNPTGYRRLHSGFNAAAVAIAIGLVIWTKAIKTLVDILEERLPPEAQRRVLETALSIMPSKGVLWLFVGLAAYTLFLRYLHTILTVRSDRSEG